MKRHSRLRMTAMWTAAAVALLLLGLLITNWLIAVWWTPFVGHLYSLQPGAVTFHHGIPSRDFIIQKLVDPFGINSSWHVYSSNPMAKFMEFVPPSHYLAQVVRGLRLPSAHAGFPMPGNTAQVYEIPLELPLQAASLTSLILSWRGRRPPATHC